jgi:hypothetical protein
MVRHDVFVDLTLRDLLMDVSGNSLSGTIPSFPGVTTIRNLLLSANNFTGTLPPLPKRTINFYAGMIPG